MQKTVRRVKALVVSRIADLERDLRLECAPFLTSTSASSSSSSSSSSSAGTATREGEAAEPAFELELVAYAPPPSGAAQADEADEARKLVALLRESEVVVADPALVAPHLHHLATTGAGDLRWMQSTWAGVDSLFRALGHEQPHKPVPSFGLTRLGGVFGKPMAEYVFAFVLSRERKLPLLRDLQERREWRGAHDGYDYRPLSSLTLGVMGLGDIGRELARVGKAFDMRVVGLVSSKERYHHMLNAGAVDELFETHATTPGNHGRGRDIDAFLSRCDYVVNALPSTPQTKGLLGLREFSACKPGAVFINIGRGDILNEETDPIAADEGGGGETRDKQVMMKKKQEGDVILEALERGHIAGAVLDVFKSEPLAPPSRLWSAHPEVVVTPHVAAISFGRDVARLFRQNLVRYVAGRDLLFPVDWHKGY